MNTSLLKRSSSEFVTMVRFEGFSHTIGDVAKKKRRKEVKKMGLTCFYFFDIGSFACQVSFIKIKTGEKWRV